MDILHYRLSFHFRHSCLSSALGVPPQSIKKPKYSYMVSWENQKDGLIRFHERVTVCTETDLNDIRKVMLVRYYYKAHSGLGLVRVLAANWCEITASQHGHGSDRLEEKRSSSWCTSSQLASIAAGAISNCHTCESTWTSTVLRIHAACGTRCCCTVPDEAGWSGLRSLAQTAQRYNVTLTCSQGCRQRLAGRFFREEKRWWAVWNGGINDACKCCVAAAMHTCTLNYCCSVVLTSRVRWSVPRVRVVELPHVTYRKNSRHWSHKVSVYFRYTAVCINGC